MTIKNKFKHEKTKILLIFLVILSGIVTSQSNKPLFNMEEILDTTTLNQDVIQDCYEVAGVVPIFQKLLTINARSHIIFPVSNIRKQILVDIQVEGEHFQNLNITLPFGNDPYLLAAYHLTQYQLDSETEIIVN